MNTRANIITYLTETAAKVLSTVNANKSFYHHSEEIKASPALRLNGISFSFGGESYDSIFRNVNVKCQILKKINNVNAETEIDTALDELETLLIAFFTQLESDCMFYDSTLIHSFDWNSVTYTEARNIDDYYFGYDIYFQFGTFLNK